MKHILIYKNITIDLECNINSHIQNDNIFPYVEKYYKDHMPNTGNKVWFQAIANEVKNNDTDVDFLTSDMSVDYINSHYDIIIYPMANIFGRKYKQALENIAKTFETITVPTYIISCGIQAKTYDELNQLISDIGEESKKFIDAIHHTGGEFALRGNFTYEFFSRLEGGKTTAVVTGCPSLYQRGKNLMIDSTQKVSIEQFKAVLNGSLSDYQAGNFFENNICSFIDQDSFVHPLFNKSFCSEIASDRKKCIEAIKFYGGYQLEQVFSKHIQLFFETNNWYNYLKHEAISFSYGSRIHGNIMSILSGVPTLILAKDSRVQEMAEFYHIPFVTTHTAQSVEDLYEQYLILDYTDFNQNYPKLFDNFEKFMIDHKILSKIEINDSFYDISNNEYLNNSRYPAEDQFSAALTNVKKYEGFVNLLHKIKGIVTN